jgi:hypothetical protein
MRSLNCFKNLDPTGTNLCFLLSSSLFLSLIFNPLSILSLGMTTTDEPQPERPVDDKKPLSEDADANEQCLIQDSANVEVTAQDNVASEKTKDDTKEDIAESTEQESTEQDGVDSSNQAVVQDAKEGSVTSDTTKTEEADSCTDGIPDVGPFTKDDQNHPVLVLASTLANCEKTKIVIPPTPVLDIPVRPDPTKASANLIVINKPDLKTIRPNTLGPKEQEKEGKMETKLNLEGGFFTCTNTICIHLFV